MFAFNDQSPSLDLQYWLLNFIKFLGIVVIALGIHIGAKKLFARRYAATVSHEIWNTERVWFTKKLKYPLHIGAYIPVLITIFSNGQLFFPAVFSSKVDIKPAYRIGRAYEVLSLYEIAKIKATGIVANILFAIVLTMINKVLFADWIVVNTMLAIAYIVPLPKLEGLDILYGSKVVYIFTLIFVLSTAFLLNFVGGITILILGILFAIIGVIIHLKNWAK